MNPFESHPVLGFVISAVHLAAGCALSVLHIHLPPIIMELAQVGAWGAAIVAAGFTCYGVWKTHHGKKKRK